MSKKKPYFKKININAKKIIAVASGKGGVGKTTVSVNLALALAATDQRVGLLDADIYGPNVPMMLGITDQKANIKDEKLIPVKKYNIEIISVGFLTPPDQALIWRGPMANKLIDQFLEDVKWGDMDYLIIDLPPGTGDVPLSIIQKVNLSYGIIVTTPQQASIIDVKKMINMFEVTKTKILGIVDNMKYLICPDCSKKIDLFPGSDKNNRSKQLGYKIIAEFPFSPEFNKPDKQQFYLNNTNDPISLEFDNLAKLIKKLKN